MKVVRFYFDYISPYAYVGWHIVRKLGKTHGFEVHPEPVLFAAILNALGQKGPAEIPSKRVYTFKDVFRKAHAAGLGGVCPPPSHPFNPLTSLRTTIAIESLEERTRAVTAIFDAAWGRGESIEQAGEVQAILDAAGLDGAAAVARSSDPAVKEAVRLGTARAIELGVFGVPTCEVDGELFWGVDGTAFLVPHMEGKDPVSQELLDRWKDLPASARRI